MGKRSIKKQIDEALDKKVAFGTKKHGSEEVDIIRSRSTLEDYRRENKAFADWVRERYLDRHINPLNKLRTYLERPCLLLLIQDPSHLTYYK